jgi:hypothetical protein
MEPRTRLTPVGAALLALLIVCIVLVVLGSGTLQAIGFVLGVVVLLLIAGDALPRMRFGGGRPLGGMPRLRPPAGERRPKRGRRSAGK